MSAPGSDSSTRTALARRLRKRAAAAVALGCCALLTLGSGAAAVPAGSSTDESNSGSNSASSASQDTGADSDSIDSEGVAVPEGLESFYGQEVSWYPCGSTGGMEKAEETSGGSGTFSCATVTVPMDYDHPDGKTIQIALKKRAADGESRGTLFINPGGPGGSGVEQVENAEQRGFSQELMAGYDIVGFDPRGIGSSTPVNCGEAASPFEWGVRPGEPQEGQAFEDWTQGYMTRISEFQEECQENSEPGLLDHMGTVSVARDLDVLRAVSAEKSLNYLGQSYGTELGYTYAELFPENAGRMVLDGAIDSTVSFKEFDLDGLEGYENALHSYVQACQEGEAGDDCPLTGSVEDGVQQIRNLIASANAAPMPTSDPDLKITGAHMAQTIQSMGLSGGQWQDLTAALAPAITQGDASGFTGFIKQMNQVFRVSNAAGLLGVMCQDRPAQGDMESWKTQYEEAQEISPTFGAGALDFDTTCAAWGHFSESDPLPQDVRAEGAAPILVVGTTGDPATPYKWSQALSDQLDSGHLLTWEGNAHCAYGHGSSCITRAVDDFLLDGELPEDGHVCTG